MPANVVVDERIERLFLRDGGARNQERRFYYFGTDVPEAKLVGTPFTPTISPRKRTALSLEIPRSPTRRSSQQRSPSPVEEDNL